MATTNKNSMLPTYQGNYKDMIGALRAGDISNPCWMFLEDRNALAFIHWEKNEAGEKVLVPHVMLWDKIEVLDEKVEVINEQLDGLKDPETGEPIKVVEAIEISKQESVDESNSYTDSQTDIIKQSISMIVSIDEEVDSND